MLIREHYPSPNGRWCLRCGSIQTESGTYGERTCVQREDGFNKLMPEPARRQFAFEDFDTIGARLVEIRKANDAARDHVALVPLADETDALLCG